MKGFTKIQLSFFFFLFLQKGPREVTEDSCPHIEDQLWK